MKKNVFIVLLVCVACFAVGYFLAVKRGNHFAEPDNIIIRDTITIRDTVTIPKPYPIVEYRQRTDTLRVNDTVFVEIPISTKVYEDSLYKAWVSGYMASLDSILIYRAKEVITEYIEVPKIEKKKTRWGIGVQVGYGTDFQRFSPYIGVGVHYNIFSW